jgi:hypothetical protein
MTEQSSSTTNTTAATNCQGFLEPFSTYDQAHSLLGSYDCWWADLDGAHLGRFPVADGNPVPDGCGQVWGWSNDSPKQTWVRARFEQGRVLGVVLYDGVTDNPTTTTSQVRYRRRHEQRWHDNDKRITAASVEALPNTYLVIEVLSSFPLLFLDAAPNQL